MQNECSLLSVGNQTSALQHVRRSISFCELVLIETFVSCVEQPPNRSYEPSPEHLAYLTVHTAIAVRTYEELRVANPVNNDCDTMIPTLNFPNCVRG